MKGVKNVCILGGTHGDEMSGIYLLQKWKNDPDIIRRSSFTTKTLISNPEGVKLTRRYRDCDLNRSFTKENLEAEITPDTAYEISRAKELKSMLSEGGEIGPCEVLLDLHNTTANMKMCIIHRSLSDLMLHMLAYVTSKLPEGMCNCVYTPDPLINTKSLAKLGMTLEIGPQPQGVLREDIMKLHEETVMHCLDFFEAFNSGQVFPASTVVIHDKCENIAFPRHQDGGIKAVIHSSLQDKDWFPLKSCDPVFTLFSGKELLLSDVAKSEMTNDDIFYPIFVNEASYYEKNLAFTLTKKRVIRIPELQK